MKETKRLYITLLKCEKKLEKKYRKDIKEINKKYKNNPMKDQKIADIELQYYASQKALDILIENKKNRLAEVKSAA